MDSDRTSLEAERAAVAEAHRAAEVFASPPAQERSVAWHLGRKLLRAGLLWLGLVIFFAVIYFVFAKPGR